MSYPADMNRPPADYRGRTVIIAVSGGMGSGKSTVCRMLEEIGAEVFDSDAVARELMETDDELKREIVAAFGPRSYNVDATPDRSFLASVVFASESQRMLMNGIVHPRVAAAFAVARADAERRGVPVFVHESALITEVDERDQFDAIVIVQSPLSTRIRRVIDRDRTSPEAVEARVRLQPSDRAFRGVADYLIDNDGSLDELREQVRHVFDAVTATPGHERFGDSSGAEGAAG